MELEEDQKQEYVPQAHYGTENITHLSDQATTITAPMEMTHSGSPPSYLSTLLRLLGTECHVSQSSLPLFRQLRMTSKSHLPASTSPVRESQVCTIVPLMQYWGCNPDCMPARQALYQQSYIPRSQKNLNCYSTV